MSTPQETPAADRPAGKSEVRARVRSARAHLTPETVARRADALAEHLLARVSESSLVIGYLAMPGEPDLRPAMAAHLARGGEVLVPRILGGAARELEWAEWSPDGETARSAHAPVDEPVGAPTDLAARLDRGGARTVLLVPALAVDADGARLGQGGGYYDRFVAGLEHLASAPPELWAAVHSEEVLPIGAFPVESHDLRVDRILTEDGIESTGA
ncbi:MAG: 5-formyltetrahydrofolate cyclo-ligase [Nesterenkonia sp.]|nr:5-formyltetrahydrofolate cyclo-ligase [Nesterenkonia sp.]